ncbi:MAG: ferrochelatase [Bacillus sp. (in: firmicutes)]
MKKTAILLVNLGTPDAPDTASVRLYLKEFLSDRRVIDLPKWKWLPILHGIVLRTRPQKSAKLYESIWTESGSPIMIHSQAQRMALQQRMERYEVKVSLAMNYGNPSVASELEKLHEWGVRKLIVVPLFPQYSSTTTASIWDHVQRTVSQWKDVPEIIFIRDFPDHPKFIQLLASRVQHCINENGQPDALVLSYHGIPKRYVAKGDDYPSRCRQTTDAIREMFPDVEVVESFQSKFGKEPWLEPATTESLQSLAEKGKKHVHIMAPAFTADCLETIEELQQENQAVFKEAGGQKYAYIPAANDHPLFIDCLEELVMPYIRT